MSRVMNSRTKLSVTDWNNFWRVTNARGTKVQGALCKSCKHVVKTVTTKRLEAHRRSCPAKKYANFIVDDSDDKIHDLSELKKILDEDLGLFFYSASIAFTQVENVHLRRLIKRLKTFNANYQPPCRITLGDSILNRVHENIVSTKKMLLEGTDAVLKADGWRNKSTNRKYLVFSVRNINTPQAFLTFFDTSIEKEDAETLKDNIDAAIQLAKDRYNCNIYAFVSDNDFKIVAGAKLAKDQTLIRSSCASHSAHLLIKIFITPELLASVREIVNAFKCPKLEALLIARGGSRLCNFPDTRFCYLRDTCKSIVDNLDHLKELSTVEDLTVSDQIIERLFDAGFENQLTTILDHLNPICTLINKCQDPKCNVADAAEMWLSLQLPTNNYNDEIAARMKKAVHPVGYAANLLHHKYKGQLLDEEQTYQARFFLNNYFTVKARAELNEFLNSDEKYRKYAEVLDDPIAFWLYMQQENLFPALSEEVVKVMVIPASTALLEGLFSNGTYVHNLYRNRLGHIKSSYLLDIYYSLKDNIYNQDSINELMLMDGDEHIDDDHDGDNEN